MKIEIIEDTSLCRECKLPEDHRLYHAIGENCPCKSTKLGWVVNEVIGYAVIDPIAIKTKDGNIAVINPNSMIQATK